jgi:S1-C subfamily serine protease
LFVDPAAGDYHVKPGSPALGLGFVNFPMDQFGVVSPELKRVGQTPLPAGPIALSEDADQRVARWLGAEVKSVTTLGEISATGLGRAEGVLIIRVPPESEAAKAGLRSNDVILKLNAMAVMGWEDFHLAWQAADPKHHHLSLWREQKTLDIVLGTTH